MDDPLNLIVRLLSEGKPLAIAYIVGYFAKQIAQMAIHEYRDYMDHHREDAPRRRRDE